MLKYQLDSLEGLDEGARAFYEEKEGKFQLKVDGIPQGEDVTGLKAKIDELLGEKKTEAEKRKQAEDVARKAAEEAARKNGDVEALEKSWQEKLSKREQELLGTNQSQAELIKSLTVGRARRAGQRKGPPSSPTSPSEHGYPRWQANGCRSRRQRQAQRGNPGRTESRIRQRSGLRAADRRNTRIR